MTTTSEAPLSLQDAAMQDLVLTATRAAVALDRGNWVQVLDAAKRLEEHGMRLASLASRAIAARGVSS